MNSSSLFNKPFLIYVLKFIGAFCVCYLACLFVIGVSAPGGYYIDFVNHYLNFIQWLKNSLLYTSKWVLSLGGYHTYLQKGFILRMENGFAVRIGYSCLGYGVMSFWIAFIFANNGSWIKKTKWILIGLLVIWCINIARISLLLVAINKDWAPLFYMDHHTLFNIAAYIALFIMIYLFSKSDNKIQKTSSSNEY